MGTWGTSLYANDCTCDVRDTYLGFLQNHINNQEAYEKTIEQCKEYLGDMEEPFLWYALAETQWCVGRLMPEVKEKALAWIEKCGGLELWEESKTGIAGWKKTLEKLHNKLKTEQPKEKVFRKRVIPFQNPWNLYDVYAYRVHKESSSKEERAIYGKYILMQKIGEGISINTTDIVMRVQIFDRLFDDLPSVEDALETLSNNRLLPISNPLNQIDRYKRRLLGKSDPFYFNEPVCIYNPVIMSTKMEQYYNDKSYPKDEITFICTAEGPLNKQHERSDGDADGSCLWNDFHYSIGRQFALWQGLDYDVIEDGIFEYPTRKQQSKIKSEIKKE